MPSERVNLLVKHLETKIGEGGRSDAKQSHYFMKYENVYASVKNILLIFRRCKERTDNTVILISPKFK